MEKEPVSIKVGSQNINNLHYADDTTLVTRSKEDMLYLLRKVKGKSRNIGLKLNINKMKIMNTENDNDFELDRDRIEVVKHFNLLRSFINKEATISSKIVCRIAHGN